jgi:hypothetical protein
MNKETFLKLVDNVRAEAMQAEQAKLRELLGQGPRYNVINESDKSLAGQMLDLCGFSTCYIMPKKGFSRRFNWVKELIKSGELSFDDYRKSFYVYLPSTRQEVSIRESMAYAASKVLENEGFSTYVETRLD